MAIAIGIEGRIKHAQFERAGHSRSFEGLDFWAPNINIFRDPRWGRGQETYGEDPFLTARMVSTRKTSGEADFGRSFRVVAGPRLCVSPRVLRHKVSLRRAGLQKTQPLLLWFQ